MTLDFKQKREYRERSEFRQCRYCGRYFGYKDIDEGKAEVVLKQFWDWTKEEIDERYESFHVLCKERDEAKAEAQAEAEVAYKKEQEYHEWMRGKQ